MITVELIPNLLMNPKYSCELDIFVLVIDKYIYAFHNSISAN